MLISKHSNLYFADFVPLPTLNYFIDIIFKNTGIQIKVIPSPVGKASASSSNDRTVQFLMHSLFHSLKLRNGNFLLSQFYDLGNISWDVRTIRLRHHYAISQLFLFSIHGLRPSTLIFLL
mgnify:CR=1 FL=1